MQRTLLIFLSIIISFSQISASSAQGIKSNPFNNGAVRQLILSTTEMTGSDNFCVRGTYSPFGALNVWRKEMIEAASSDPQKLIDLFTADEHNYSSQTYLGTTYFVYLADNEPKWVEPSYQYFWSLEGAFNRRVYNDISLNYNKAIIQLANYYKINFKVDEKTAQYWSKFYIHALRYRSSRYGSFRIKEVAIERIKNGQYNSDDFIDIAATQYYNYSEMRAYEKSDGKPDNSARKYPDTIVYNKALTLAVGAHAPINVLAELIAMGASLNGVDEPVIFNAVDNTITLQFLLENGADVNARNGFGKTALMMAAHMNNNEALSLLLKAGANPNDKTWNELPLIRDYYDQMQPDCRYSQIKIKERTALMYAAENASLEVFKLLLEAGAKTDASDTRKRGISQYLNSNRVMTEADLNIAKKLLSAK